MSDWTTQTTSGSPLRPRELFPTITGNLGADTHVIAALYVDPRGTYAGRPDIDAWCERRDARCYAGPYPVVAHPPCKRWGRMATGGPSAPGRYKVGDDNGCFAAALAAVRCWGGVIEHPCDSKAWAHFKLRRPKRHAGWMPAGDGGWTCYVEQGHYGHCATKKTWLYVHGVERWCLPELIWTKGPQRIPQAAIDKHGYAKARRIGAMGWIGGKDKTRIREATPDAFRDVLIGIARLAKST